MKKWLNQLQSDIDIMSFINYQEVMEIKMKYQAWWCANFILHHAYQIYFMCLYKAFVQNQKQNSTAKSAHIVRLYSISKCNKCSGTKWAKHRLALEFELQCDHKFLSLIVSEKHYPFYWGCIFLTQYNKVNDRHCLNHKTVIYLEMLVSFNKVQ